MSNNNNGDGSSLYNIIKKLKQYESECEKWMEEEEKKLETGEGEGDSESKDTKLRSVIKHLENYNYQLSEFARFATDPTFKQEVITQIQILEQNNAGGGGTERRILENLEKSIESLNRHLYVYKDSENDIEKIEEKTILYYNSDLKKQQEEAKRNANKEKTESRNREEYNLDVLFIKLREIALQVLDMKKALELKIINK